MTDTDFSKYDNKQVVVVRNLPDKNEAVEVEGKVQVGNAMGLLIKPKGKVQFELIHANEIVEVRYVAEKLKPLKAKELKPVEYGSARAHLLERHGVDLDWINSNAEEAALEYHSTLDHEALKLGHVHKAVNESARSQAVAEAEAAQEEQSVA